jgi:hypothetical protein
MFVPGKVDHGAFDEITPESSYWVGFLLADGYVFTKHGSYKDYPMIELKLSERDGDHVRKFASFVKSEYAVRSRAYDTNYKACARYTVTSFMSERLVNRLAELGVGPKKSMRETVHPLLALSPDFWRGVVDGDGYVGMVSNRGRLYPKIQLGSSKSVMEKFVDLASTLGVSRPPLNFSKNLYACGWTATPAAVIVDHLYNRPGPSLDRKREAATLCQQWISRRGERLV